jgi:membrane protease YdiL (CAAX protease family)
MSVWFLAGLLAVAGAVLWWAFGPGPAPGTFWRRERPLDLAVSGIALWLGFAFLRSRADPGALEAGGAALSAGLALLAAAIALYAVGGWPIRGSGRRILLAAALWAMAFPATLLIGLAAEALAPEDAAGPYRQEALRVFAGATPSARAWHTVTLALAVPIVEECIFRGCFQRALRPLFARVGALALRRTLAAASAALLFAAVHDFALLPAVFGLGLLLGLVLEWRGEILSPIVLHALHNMATLHAPALFGARP